MFVKKLAMVTTTVSTALLGTDAEGDCYGAFPPGSAVGDIVLVSAPVEGGTGSDVLLFLDEAGADDAPDARADRVFRLQVAGPTQLQRRMVGVSVEWDDQAVTVDGGLRGEFRLTTSSSNSSNPLPSTVVGFGLSQAVGWDVTLPVAAPTASDYLGLAALATMDARCDSGGEGADSCGNDCGSRSCWVSCRAGYYACCNCSGLGTPKCKCVKEEPSQ